MSFSPIQSPPSAIVLQTPKEREADKSETVKSEDISYVANHTLTCLLFDLTGAQAALSTLISGGMKESRDRAAGLAVEKAPFRQWRQRFLSNAKNWWIGEIVGDLGAVPVTIAVQRTFPGVISVLSHGLEKPLGPFYRLSARNATDHWAVRHGVMAGSPEYNEHEDQVYHCEVDHLGDAAVWTGAAFTGNVLAQKVNQVLFQPAAERLSTKEIMGGKLGGALLATGAVVALRALAPAQAQSWDRETSKHVLRPASRFFHRRAKEATAGTESRPGGNGFSDHGIPGTPSPTGSTLEAGVVSPQPVTRSKTATEDQPASPRAQVTAASVAFGERVAANENRSASVA